MNRRIIALMLILIIVLFDCSAMAEYSRIANSKAPVYADSDLQHKIGTIPKWTSVTVKSTSSGVAKINVAGNKGYIKTAYLADAYDISPFELYGTLWVTKKCKVYIFPSTKSKGKTLKKGIEVETITGTKNWTLVQSLNHKYMGYVLTKNLDLNP